MLGLLAACLALLPLTVALPFDLGKRGDGSDPPRSVVYVQTFHYTNGSRLSLLPLVQQETRITHVYLAAVHINSSPGDINLNDDNPNSTVWNDIWSEASQLQQDGVKVMFMLGGAAQGSYQNLCSGSNGAVINEAYYGPLRDTISYHNIDGIDLDIEESVDGSCPLALLQRFNSDFGTNFILTMSPVASELGPDEYGLGGFSYSQLDAAATASGRPNGKLVNWYNAQFYNGWGDASSPVGYNAIVKNGYSPDRVHMGILDSSRDGSSGWNNISTYESTISTLKANYANFGGTSGWEYWDAGVSDGDSDPWQWVEALAPVIFGSTSAAVNKESAPVPEGEAPWPQLMSTLQSLGAGRLEAVKALNVSDGNLDQALQILGLSQLLPLSS